MIGNQFPQLTPVTVERLGEGFDNSVFLSNQQYVFRFPRREIAASLIETESRILPVLAPLLPIPIPNPIYNGVPEGNYPCPFAGYEILPGVSPARLKKDQRMLSVEPFGQFLKVLHNFPVSEAERLRVPYDQLERLNFVKRKPMLEKYISQGKNIGLLEVVLEELLIEFLSTVKGNLEDQAKSLVHGDLHMRNLLVGETGQVSAVIDWGDVHIGHPALDLSIVYSFLPPDGREEFFKIYGEVSEEVKKAARFKAIYTCVLLLLYANDQNDEELVRECQSTLVMALND